MWRQDEKRNQDRKVKEMTKAELEEVVYTIY